ncbi:hypothetical protein [Nocardia jiangxiensis]|uniref:hypothetical protein n=1 Tax=Nocardia jiangxiensis TaxID=282685 RepID=UPI0012F69A1E|nr:hypothetical protein [Nocardia jiangxiensis]
MTKKQWQHGSYYGYNKKGCKCDPCVEAGREYAETWRQRHLESRVLIHGRLVSTTLKIHGTCNGYTNFGCRCISCTAANTEAVLRNRRKKNDSKAAAGAQ